MIRILQILMELLISTTLDPIEKTVELLLEDKLGLLIFLESLVTFKVSFNMGMRSHRWKKVQILLIMHTNRLISLV